MFLKQYPLEAKPAPKNFNTGLRPCHTKPRSYCVGTEFSKFPERSEIASKSWYFPRKWPITASLQRPWCCYRTRMAFYHVPMEFSLAILCVVTTVMKTHPQGIFPPFRSFGHGLHCIDFLFYFSDFLRKFNPGIKGYSVGKCDENNEGCSQLNVAVAGAVAEYDYFFYNALKSTRCHTNNNIWACVGTYRTI